MPTFPNINTLRTKTKLSGDEIIQISASEKVSLEQIIRQLGFGGEIQGPLTPIGNLSMPDVKDSLITALSKIISLSGNNKLNIIPVPTTSDEGGLESIRFIIMVSEAEDMNGQSGYVAQLIFNQNNIVVKIVWADSSLVNRYSTVSDLDKYLNSEKGDILWVFKGERLLKAGGSNITILPGDNVFHTGTSQDITITLPYSSWEPSPGGFYSRIENSEGGIKSTYTAGFTSKVNVTRSMFVPTYVGDNAVHYLFMPDFDDNPGTTYQHVSFQLVSYGDGLYILVNKCGYDEYNFQRTTYMADE